MGAAGGVGALLCRAVMSRGGSQNVAPPTSRARTPIRSAHRWIEDDVWPGMNVRTLPMNSPFEPSIARSSIASFVLTISAGGGAYAFKTHATVSNTDLRYAYSSGARYHHL